MTLSKPSERRAKWSFLLIFLLLAAGIVALGYRYYRNYDRQFRAAAEQQLLAIAELKAGELAQWRQERMAGANIFFQNPSFSALVRRCLAQPADGDAQRQLLDWLGKYAKLNDYNQVRLMDAQVVTRLSAPAGLNPASSNTVQAASEVLRSGQVAWQDFYRHEQNQRIYLAVLVPILDEAEANRPLGVLVLRIDPATYLYPFIQRWPVLSSTAETLLLRRDGNEVLYLNDLRHQSNAALALRLSVARTEVPAVKAALGQTGIMPGTDYRGVPVLAAAQAVTNSPWFLVAKVDTAEVLAPMRERLWQVVVMLGLLLFGAGAGVGLVWRQQRVRFYREQVAAAETLRASQERFQQLFELSADLVCIADIEGRFREINPAFAKVLGYPKEELVSRPFLDFVHPEDRDKTLQVTKDKLRQGKTVLHFENRYLCKDGGFVWLEWTSQPSVAMGVTFAIARDVTARKQAEVALRLKNLVFDVSIAANSVAGLDGVITEANDAFLLCWGYRSKEEVIGHPLSYFFKDSNEAEAIVSALNEKGQWEGDFTAKKRDGSIFIAHTMATVVRSEDGKVTGYQSSIVDITERKQAEAALREAEWKFRALFEQGPIGVAYHEMIYDPAGQPIDYRFLDANESYRELTGVDPRGKTVTQAFPGIENDPFDWIGTFGRVARTGVPIRFEQYLQFNGRWYDCVAYQYQPDHFVVAFLNITARKLAEAALQREQEFARALLDNITDGVVACDAQGTLVLFNRTAREWHGMDALALPPEEWGRHYSLYGPDGATPLPTEAIPLVRAFRGETIRDVGMTINAQGQPPRHLLAAGCPFFDAQHNLLGAVVAMRDFTERKRTEEKLRTIMQAVESTSDAVGISDAQWRHFYQNRALSDLLEYATAEELQAAGGPASVFKDPQVAEELSENIRSGKSWAGELELVTKTGRVFPAYTRADAIVDSEGKIIGLIAVIRDITARKQAEEQLAAITERLHFATAAAKAGVWDWNLQTNEMIWDDRMRELYGLTRENFPGGIEAWKQGLHPDDSSRAIEECAAALRRERDFDTEFRVLRPDGTVVHIKANGLVLRDEQGKLLRMIGLNIDITGRKQAEEKLLTIMKAVESTSDAVGISDAQGRHFFQNQALSDLFGYATAEELQAAGGGPVVVKDPAVAKEMFERIMSGKSWAGELEMVTKSGRVFPAYERADAVLDNAGKVIGLIGIISDITARQAAEAQLQRTLADLKRSNQELEQFAYIASHDLQEPLRMVASYTQLLAQRYEGQLDDKANKYIHYAVDGALRMQTLINDLLAYSRVGTRGQPLEPTDTQAVLGEALRNLTATIAESQAVITNDNLPTVSADAAQLVLVFQNLLANAIKFRGQDLPRVHISAQERPGEWVFAVQDNGIGIEPQHAERVFVIFQRLHTREEYPGTGIGLAVCQRIVERHGGKIWFASVPGNGSTFFFTVPK